MSLFPWPGPVAMVPVPELGPFHGRQVSRLVKRSGSQIIDLSSLAPSNASRYPEASLFWYAGN